jgi:Protein of unknown function (DUF664)
MVRRRERRRTTVRAVTLPRHRPPPAADERTSLLGWLDLQRALVPWKCEGLSEEDAHRVLLPTSPLTTVAGIVSHLRWTEHCWFQVAFLDREAADNPQFGDVEDADFLVDDAPLARLLDEYEQECERSNDVIAAASLDETGRNRAFASGSASLRWMLLHMLEETGRHLGHLDAMRELLDGRRGYY